MLKADLHIHTEYSMDCQMHLDKIIERCQELGINCIAVADHGTAEGALKMQEIAPFQVIVAEEIMTTEGEIMGMFLKETIKSEKDSRLTPEEAVARIREQGGLVNIPHPFETIRGSALKDWAIDDIAKDVDIIEVLNSRSPFAANTEKAKAFAEKHGIPGSAGSDAHTLSEIGNAYVEMPEFKDKNDFLAALKKGQVYGRRASMYVRLFSTWARVKSQFRTRK